MATALTTYGTTTAATTIPSANTLVTITGGATTNKNTLIGTSTGYGQVASHGSGSAWPSLGSIGAANGKGLLLDSTLLLNQLIVAGNWTPTIRLNVSDVSIIADLYIRTFVVNSGIYTQIGSSMVLSAQTITTSVTNYAFSATSLPSQTFRTNDLLYWDLWANITTNLTANSAATLKFYESSSATQGSTQCQLVTPGYNPAPSAYSFTRRRNTIGASR